MGILDTIVTIDQTIETTKKKIGGYTDALGITEAQGSPPNGKAVGLAHPTNETRELKLRTPRATSGGGGGGAPAVQGEPRDLYDVPGVTSEKVLEEIAQRIYEERSRQELSGTAVTYEMRVPAFGVDRTVGAAHLTVPEIDTEGDEIDLLTLGAGDVIRIEFDPEHIREIGQLSDLEDRIDRMVGLGYSESVAEVVARNLVDYAKLTASFFVRAVRVTMETTAEGGTFEVEIDFCNRIQIDGSTSPAAG